MGAFNHAAHVRLAFELLAGSDSFDAAVDRMAETLRAKAAEAGQPGTYHHTVTVFWMRMVARLLDQDLPLAYYSHDRLFSDEARLAWIEPDIQSFDGTPLRSSHSSGDASHRPVSR